MAVKERTVQMKNIKLVAEKYLCQGAFIEEIREHLEGTAKLAQELAIKYNLPPDEGYEAGYWHDVSRGWSDEQSLESIRKWEIKLDADELSTGSSLIHGHIAARLWQDEFGPWAEWQHAIDCHTLGTANPTLYDQIIGIADFAAYGRKKQIVAAIRQFAFTDLSKAYLAVYESKCKHLMLQGKRVHPRAQNILLALQRSQNAG